MILVHSSTHGKQKHTWSSRIRKPVNVQFFILTVITADIPTQVPNKTGGSKAGGLGKYTEKKGELAAKKMLTCRHILYMPTTANLFEISKYISFHPI